MSGNNPFEVCLRVNSEHLLGRWKGFSELKKFQPVSGRLSVAEMNASKYFEKLAADYENQPQGFLGGGGVCAGARKLTHLLSQA